MKDKEFAYLRKVSMQYHLKSICVVLGVLYLIDSILGFRFLSFYLDRKILFLAFFLTVILFYYSNLIKIKWSYSIITIAIFITLNIFWLFWGPLKYHSNWRYALADWRPFFTLILFLLLINTKNSILSLIEFKKIIVFTSVILMLFMVLLYLIGNQSIKNYGNYTNLIFFTDLVIYPKAYIGLMPDGFFRVLWLSSIWIIFAVFWCDEIVRWYWVRLLFYLLCAIALLVTYTRGLWIGIGFGIIITLLIDCFVSYQKKQKNYFSVTNISILTIPFVWGVSSCLSQNIHDRFLGSGSNLDPSINVRMASINSLLEYWLQTPILGHGYGAFVPNFIRDINAPFSYEVFPFALLMKLGVIGFLVFYSFFGIIIYTSLKNYHHPMASRFVGAMIAFLIITATNPYLFNLVGMTVLGVLLLQWAEIVDTN